MAFFALAILFIKVAPQLYVTVSKHPALTFEGIDVSLGMSQIP